MSEDPVVSFIDCDFSSTISIVSLLCAVVLDFCSVGSDVSRLAPAAFSEEFSAAYCCCDGVEIKSGFCSDAFGSLKAVLGSTKVARPVSSDESGSGSCSVDRSALMKNC